MGVLKTAGQSLMSQYGGTIMSMAMNAMNGMAGSNNVGVPGVPGGSGGSGSTAPYSTPQGPSFTSNGTPPSDAPRPQGIVPPPDL